MIKFKDFANKKELMWIGIGVIIFIILVFVMVQVLPLKVAEPVGADINKIADINTEQNKIDINQQTEIAKFECLKMCTDYKDTISYEDGPCLSDAYGFKLDDWVCDVSHNPRVEIDDDKENQCKEYVNKNANHFVEVDENCGLIRIY